MCLGHAFSRDPVKQGARYWSWILHLPYLFIGFGYAIGLLLVSFSEVILMLDKRFGNIKVYP